MEICCKGGERRATKFKIFTVQHSFPSQKDNWAHKSALGKQQLSSEGGQHWARGRCQRLRSCLGQHNGVGGICLGQQLGGHGGVERGDGVDLAIHSVGEETSLTTHAKGQNVQHLLGSACQGDTIAIGGDCRHKGNKAIPVNAVVNLTVTCTGRYNERKLKRSHVVDLLCMIHMVTIQSTGDRHYSPMLMPPCLVRP